MTAYNDILDERIDGYEGVPAAVAEHLEFLGDIELSPDDYSFDLMRVLRRKHDDVILYAFDSGCSCPAPFEDVRVSDLIEGSLDTLADVAVKYRGTNPESMIRKAVADLVARA